MSKQPHDQDEQQAPSGAESASSGGEAGKPTASGRRRSRRYDKAGGKQAAGATQGKSDAAQAPAGGGEAGAGKTASSAADTSASRPEQGDKPASGSDKSAAAKPAAEKPAAEKPATEKPAASQQAASAKPAAPSGSAAKPSKADTSAKAGKAAGSGGSTAPAGGGASGGTTGTSAGNGGKGGGKAGVLALVLVILLAVGVGLFGWQAWQKLDAQQQRLASLPGDVASQSDLGELQGQLESAESERDAALDSALSDLRGEFSDYRGSVDETLDKVLDELSREQDTDERDWLHAEAAYLLRLANQRLQLERDVEGAAALLRTADERLIEADNPALVPVRREIASELAALDSVPRVDRTGLYLALNAQQEQLAGQPLAQEIEEITADAAALEEAPTGGWQEQLARFGGELKELVTVRQHDQALEALISPEQESYLRQSVRLVLEQSQLALLKEEQELYEASLDKALALIRGYYDTEASGVQSVIERLEELKQQSIRPELPDISGSQQALATFIERRFEGRDDGQGDDA
ncbi:uroporphyrinogen-III C-methyltransferase [Halomonas rhizosphaerae]|uniref:Uroporphyrinogen-III C-methyltransferase n=1 Tax=Halomonas rhizosphaerae TaxID=3043296 RepID=A0ABT6UZD7_9GAMM|nr:uroporphyrinogen-III C-methyltransferase [Halomonas rhizosphaerae]MDI5890077.1 uroporphyrinogen-III C-methyltransferase [Halomonas rhizosphaerae]